jgi:DME family drug/metabolite transporter
VNASLVAYCQILLGALLLSTGATIIKAVHFTAPELAAWRAVVITAFLAAAVRPSRRLFTKALIPAAVAHAITTLLFMWGNKLTSAATAIFLQYTAPVYLLLLGPWLLKEPVDRRDFAFVSVIGGGMLLLLTHPGAATRTASNPHLGGVVAAACGVAWAFTTLTMRGLARTPTDGFERSIAAVIVANAALAAILLPVVGIPDGAQPRDWGLVLYMGIFQLGSAFILIALGLRRVTALEGALLLLLEPVLNPLWAWAVHDEVPGWPVLAGGALIVAATGTRAVFVASRHRASHG